MVKHNVVMHYRLRQWDFTVNPIPFVAFLLLIPIIGFSIGCTAVPKAEFTTYKETFSAARVVGEQILIDYAVSKNNLASKKAEIAKISNEKKNIQDSPIRKIMIDKHVIADLDEISVNMKAWEAIEKYNKFLAAIIEGKELNEIEEIYNGFNAIKNNMPEKLAKKAIEAMGAWQPIIELAVEAGAVEARKQRFLLKVKEGAPIVSGAFSLLRDDADRFSQVELAINDVDRRGLLLKFDATRERIWNLLNEYKYEDADVIIKSIKQITRSVPGYTQDYPGSFTGDDTSWPGDPTFNDKMNEIKIEDQLNPARQAINQLIEEYKDLRSKLEALQTRLEVRLSVYEAYLTLLYQVDNSVRNLALISAKYAKEQNALPDPEIMRRTIIEIRKLIELRHSI